MQITVVAIMCHALGSISQPVCREEIVVKDDMPMQTCMLSQAAIAIDPIIYDQESRFGLRQRRILEAVVSAKDVARDKVDAPVYAKILDAVSSTTRDPEGDDGSEQVLGILRGTSSDDYSLIELRAQAHHHVVFIAAPVFDAARRVIGALTLLGFGAPLSGEDIDAIGQRLLLSAGAVSEALMGS